MSDPASARHPTPLDVLAWGVVIAALISLALIRITPDGTPVHLATAREALRSGHWPTVNTFSYTHPEYPVYNQYPIYQAVLYGVFQRFGWEGLSVFHGLAWGTIFALAIVWGGGFRKAATRPLVWAIVLLGLQRRMILRPDIGTLMCVLVILIASDLYSRKPWTASSIFVGCQWCFANTHQLYPIGIALIGSFWLQQMYGRLGFMRQSEDRQMGASAARTSILPVTLGLIGALGACLATPLGWEIVKGPAHTLSSLSDHRAHVAEFSRLWSSSYDVVLSVIALTLGVTGLVRRRSQLPVLEVMFFLMSGVLAISAIRGVPFLVLAGLGSYSRSLPSWAAPHTTRARSDRDVGLMRLLGIVATCLMGSLVLNERWVVRSRVLGGSQFGLGKALGAWPDRAVQFVRTNPPNGLLLNLTWYSGNALMWDLYPRVKLFVDPRFEAYPRQFLLDVSKALDRPDVLDRLLATYQPGWLFLETAFPGPQMIAKRLTESAKWTLVYADTMALVLVSVDQNAELASRLAVDLDGLAPPDLDPNKDIAALQWTRWAGLMRAFELPDGEQMALEQARRIGAGFIVVQRALNQYPAALP